MEKLLKVEFFKSQGFVTKGDGLLFIKSVPELVDYIKLKNEEVLEYTNEKLVEFENEMDKYDENKAIFLKTCRMDRKTVTAEKVMMHKEEELAKIKQDARNEAREEILAEMKKEKETVLLQKYTAFVPKFGSNELEQILLLPNLFLQYIEKLESGEKILEPHQKVEYQQILRASESHINSLLTIKNGLEQLLL
jgi:hypothetical protein